MKKVVITGGTSFTALWIAHAFNIAGWSVQTLIPKTDKDYSGIKLKRLQLLKRFSEICADTEVASGAMENWILNRSFDIWIHHHHHMTEFRSPRYDIQKSNEVGVAPLEGLVNALAKVGCKGVLFSGSYFEDAAQTPYAKSKAKVWLELSKLCAGALNISKIVIPDPIGPLENEDRIIPRLIAAAELRKSFELLSKSAVNDHLPVRALAKVYVRVAENLLSGKKEVLHPSGLIVKNEDWIKTVNSELLPRLGLEPCKLIFKDEPAPSYQNPASEKEEMSWSEEWDHYATIYRESKDR